jgi:hypothetical protein
MCDIKFIVFCNCLSDSLNISAQENCIHRQYVLYFILVMFHCFKVKTAVFWDVTPCSLVEVDQHFRGAYSLHLTLLMKTVHTPETLVNFYQTTWCNIPEDSLLRTCHHENLKSRLFQGQFNCSFCKLIF